MENSANVTNNTKNIPLADMSMSRIVRDVTNEYIDSLKGMPVLPLFSEMEEELLRRTKKAFALYNSQVEKGRKLTIPKVLFNSQIEALILNFRKVVRVSSGQERKKLYCPLAMYMTDGPDKGTYSMDESEIENLIWELNPQAQTST